MIKFLVKIGAFLLIILICDVLLGDIFAFLVENAKGGDNKRNNYICNEIDREDILIFGSSRAIHHYNPIMISDSTRMSCYNCGQDGNGAILNYGRFHLISQRYYPKLIIIDVFPTYDLLIGENNQKYLGWLRPYYDKPGMPELFESVDKKERIKMLSNMYRYNSRFVQIISDYLHPMRSEGINGFRPIKDEFDTMKIRKKVINERKPQYDSLKICFIKKLIEESLNTKIVFCVSPYWNGGDTTTFQPIKDLCMDKKIPFIDYSNNSKYVHHNEFFVDGSHLNSLGADEYTRDIINEIKTRNIIQ